MPTKRKPTMEAADLVNNAGFLLMDIDTELRNLEGQPCVFDVMEHVEKVCNNFFNKLDRQFKLRAGDYFFIIGQAVNSKHMTPIKASRGVVTEDVVVDMISWLSDLNLEES